MDNKQLLLRVSAEKAMQLTWDMIGRARRDADGYLLYLKPGTPPADTAAWRAWLARTFDVPVFLHLPCKFSTPTTTASFLRPCCAAKTCCPPRPAAVASASRVEPVSNFTC